jgi:hypothetical protein
MKHLIEKVLNRHRNGQFNMGSESARKMLAAEIEAVLQQNKQIIEIERELYRGEG